MDMNTFIHYTLSVYAIFLIVDIAKAYKDSVHYKLKYMVVLPSQKFLPLLINNQKWSIIGIACLMIWVQILISILG